jgi:hypothetical protein
MASHVSEPCKNETRLDRLETKVDDHDKRLAQGDVGFAEMRKDIGALTEKVSELISVLKSSVCWILGTVGTIATGAVVWALVQSYGKGQP